jgi:hypothetical protein
VALRATDSDKVIAFQPWLEQHARQLVSLSAELQSDGPQLHLPCAELVSLTSLRLYGQMLLLDSSDSDSLSAAAAEDADDAGSCMLVHAAPRPQPLPELRQLKTVPLQPH